MKTTKIVWAAALAGAVCLPAAQAAPATAAPHPRSTINHRLANQSARIQQGTQDGQLIQGQATRLQNHDENIADRTQLDRSKDDGHLTAGERRRLDGSLNRNSGRIWDDRHDGKTGVPTTGTPTNSASTTSAVGTSPGSTPPAAPTALSTSASGSRAVPADHPRLRAFLRARSERLHPGASASGQ